MLQLQLTHSPRYMHLQVLYERHKHLTVTSAFKQVVLTILEDAIICHGLSYNYTSLLHILCVWSSEVRKHAEMNMQLCNKHQYVIM